MCLYWNYLCTNCLPILLYPVSNEIMFNSFEQLRSDKNRIICFKGALRSVACEQRFRSRFSYYTILIVILTTIWNHSTDKFIFCFLIFSITLIFFFFFFCFLIFLLTLIFFLLLLFFSYIFNNANIFSSSSFVFLYF